MKTHVAGTAGAIRVGISACLLGEAVRYDGGHKRAQFLIDAFGDAVEWVPVCPEVEAGFGTPREPVQLLRTGGSLGLVTVTTLRDLTAPMDEFIHRRLPELRVGALSGYVLKATSPSCGLDEVKIFDREYPLRAHVERLEGLSAHADLPDFKWWFEAMARDEGIGQAFLVHGEPESAAALATVLKDYCDEEPIVPRFGETFEV